MVQDLDWEAIQTFTQRDQDEREPSIPDFHSSGSSESVVSTSDPALWRLYVSHFLSTWNTRVFEFGAVLYLVALFPGTLMPMSVYAVARAGAAIVFSPMVGRYIDSNNRLRVIRLSIASQRLAVAVSCAALLSLAILDGIPIHVKYLVLVALSVLACVEKLGSVMNLVSVEKDWVIEVATNSNHDLADLNAQMRRIDLLCKLLGPLVIALVDGFSTNVAIVFNLAMNILSLPLEYWTIASVYRKCPALQQTKQAHDNNSSTRTNREPNWWTILSGGATTVLRQNRDYLMHEAFLPSFALALLYFTVLSFGGQMVAYLIFAGFSSFYVMSARTGAVVFEMSATWAAPLVMDRIGSVRAGAWFATWQTLALAAGVAFFWTAEPVFVAASGLAIGTIVSRTGLRGFELAAQIIVQDEVEADKRGAFSSVEASWQNLFELCAFVTTIVCAKPQQFHWPVLMSLVATAIASITYAWFVRRRRGHLVHLSDCIDLAKRSRSSSTGISSAAYELVPRQRDDL